MPLSVTSVLESYLLKRVHSDHTGRQRWAAAQDNMFYYGHKRRRVVP